MFTIPKFLPLSHQVGRYQIDNLRARGDVTDGSVLAGGRESFSGTFYSIMGESRAGTLVKGSQIMGEILGQFLGESKGNPGQIRGH